jgi:hypothetical protein
MALVNAINLPAPFTQFYPNSGLLTKVTNGYLYTAHQGRAPRLLLFLILLVFVGLSLRRFLGNQMQN